MVIQTSVLSILTFRDNQSDLCPDIEGSRIAGNIHTENNDKLENVTVSLMNNVLDFTSMDVTDNNGDYAFENIVTNSSYSVSSSVNGGDPLQGVSTLDIILIQRHILGLEELGSPFKLIAADADNSGNISAVDLLSIRKLILGVTDEFPNGQSVWRFPEEKQTFVDPRFPFPYNEEIQVFDMQGNMENQNFMAVKIGDVNGSYEANSKDNDEEIERRSNTVLELTVEDRLLIEGEQVVIPFFGNDVTINGFQNTINFDSDKLTLVDITSDLLDLNEDNIGLSRANEGVLTLSWDTREAMDMEASTAMFELIFDVKRDAQLSDELFIDSNVTPSEAYDSELNVMELNLEFRGQLDESFVTVSKCSKPILGDH